MKKNKIGTLFLVSLLAIACIGISYGGFTDIITVYGSVNTATVELTAEDYSGTWVYKIWGFPDAPNSPPDNPALYDLTNEILIYRGFTNAVPTPDAIYGWAAQNGGQASFESYAYAAPGTSHDGIIYDVDMIWSEIFPCINFTADVIIHYSGSIPARVNITDVVWRTGDEYYDFSPYVTWSAYRCTLDETTGNWIQGEAMEFPVQMHYCECVGVVATIHLPQDNTLQGKHGAFSFNINAVQWNDQCDESGPILNLPPVFEQPSPTDGSTGNPLDFDWSIPISDPEGDTFQWSITCSNGQSNTAYFAANGTKSRFLSGLTYSTTYTVWVNATDPTGSGQWTRRWYTFTTEPQDHDYIYTVINGTATIIGYMGPGGAVTFPSTLDGYPVVAIGSYAFFYSSYFTSVILPNSVITIEEGAFRSVDTLTSITIPVSVNTIEDHAFSDCNSLIAIDVSAGNVNYASVDGVLYNKAITTLIQCPGGKAGTFTIPNNVTTIGHYAFGKCRSLTSVILPNSVTSIEIEAFTDCRLPSIIIPDGVTTIGDRTFRYCSLLTSITFLGLVAPTTVGEFWIEGTPAEIRGHAYAASNFPAPGGDFYGLTMGIYISP